MTDDEFQRALDGARRGDEQAFASIWTEFHPRLLRVARSLAGAGDADDVASAVWVDVVRSIDVFAGDADGFRAWLFTLARRRLVDLRRRQARRPEVVVDHELSRSDPDADPAAAVDAAASTEAALALIASLPPDQAEVVLLRVVAGLDVATVAQIVGKRPGTVRVLSHRGLHALGRRLAVTPSDDLAGPGVTP